jgi:hypothetical protein
MLDCEYAAGRMLCIKLNSTIVDIIVRSFMQRSGERTVLL